MAAGALPLEDEMAKRRKYEDVGVAEQAKPMMDVAMVDMWKPPSNTVVTTKNGGYYYVKPSFDELAAEFQAIMRDEGTAPEMMTFDIVGTSMEKRVLLFTRDITAIIDISNPEPEALDVREAEHDAP